MNWYIVKLVFSIEQNEKEVVHSQFDEQLRLVQANNTNQAYFKARAIGKKEEVSFSDVQNETIKWRFIDISEVNFLGELKDGLELYSSTVEIDEKSNFINAILQKGMSIQSRGLLMA
jgi:hypothetical protein